MYEIKETGTEALTEMNRFIESDLTGYSMNTFARDNHIFYKNMEVAQKNGLAKEAIELSCLLTQKLVNMIVDLPEPPQDPETWTFDFSESNDPRKGKPYVAKITGLDAEGKFNREFYDFEQTYGRKEVLVEGSYTAAQGDIVEIRTGGSWKNDYRSFYIVWDGKVLEIGLHNDAYARSDVKKYLRGDIQATEFEVVKRTLDKTE